MLAWILLLPCRVFASLAPTLNKPSATVAGEDQLGLRLAPSEANSPLGLPAEIQLNIFAQLGFGGLYHASLVSKHFYKLAYRILLPSYGYKFDGRNHLCYTRILDALEELVYQAEEVHGLGKAHTALQGSLDYMCLKLVVNDKFGHCIHYSEGSIPRFVLQAVTLDILNDVHRISALPYILDQALGDPEWIYYVRGLADLGRVDLLQQMTFPGMDFAQFQQLMSVFLPESVVMAAVKSLQANEPQMPLSSLFSFVESGGQADLMPEDQPQPLFILRHLQERSIPVPDSWMFIDGLEEHSISFWMYLLAQKSDQARRLLLELVLKHGDGRTRLLAIVFDQLISENNSGMTNSDLGQSMETDVYQAMLLHFRSLFPDNVLVGKNCAVMLERLQATQYHTKCALIDFGQPHLIETKKFQYSEAIVFEALASKMYRIRNDSLNPFLYHCFSQVRNATHLLKNLVLRKANESYIGLMWKAVIMQSHDLCADDSLIYAPLESLQRLAFAKDVSVSAAEEILCIQDELEQDMSIDDSEHMRILLEEFESDSSDDDMRELHAAVEWFGLNIVVPDEARNLYTVMFWEASEKIIWHFLGQLPGDYLLDYNRVLHFVLLNKHSPQLCVELLKRQELETSTHLDMRAAQLGHFRPDMVKEFMEAPKLLKNLIRSAADEASIQAAWDFIHSIQTSFSAESYLCLVPPSVLKTLMFGHDIPIGHIEEMLDMLTGFELQGICVPKEAHVLYTGMFWEAPEEVIWNLLGQLLDDYMLDFERVLDFVLLPKYSDELCRELILRLENTNDSLRKHLIFALLDSRPDLARELSLLEGEDLIA